MAYLALARRWRPRQFRELVGQDHVVRALLHAVGQDRLHHAYLFTGTRGVGKTTLARILAKAINCESVVSGEPCGTCSRCLAVDDGRFVDLIEVDAASRTKVEDTRELLENVVYAPTQGRCKVYLIDEVHMLSAHSFNALLKTLEEPPSHVKFLLATTDPQKIPVTVLSRCLQFNLKRLSLEQIREQMEAVLAKEGIPFEANAVRLLSRAADGSLRDGLSLLDQAISHGGGRLMEPLVADLLGTIPRAPVFGLLDALARLDAGELLRRVAELDQWAPDYRDLLATLLGILHHAAVAQWAPEVVQGEDDAEAILRLARTVAAEDLQLFYQIALLGQRDLPLSPDPRIGFEMLMLRMLGFRPQTEGNAQRAPQRPPPGAIPSRAEGLQSREALKKPCSEQRAPLAQAAPADWGQLVRSLGLSAMAHELASNTSLIELTDSECRIGLDARLEHLKSPRAIQAIEASLVRHLARPVKLRVEMIRSDRETPAAVRQRSEAERQSAAHEAIEADPVINALKSTLDARVLPGTIQSRAEDSGEMENHSL